MKDTTDPESEIFFAQLVANHCADSIVITDAGGLTEWVNPAFSQLTGFDLKDMLGKKPGALLQGDGTDTATVRNVGQAIRARQPYKGEILNFTRGGRAYWIEMSIRPVFDNDGRHTHFISVERDITERKALERRAEDAFGLETRRQDERRLIGLTSEWLYTAKSMEELNRVIKHAMQTIFPETEGQLYIYSNSRDGLNLSCSWGGGTPNAQIDASDCWALRRGRAYSYGTQAIEFTCDHVDDKGAPYICIPIIANGDTIGLLHVAFPLLIETPSSRASIEEYLNGRRELALLCAEQVSIAIANVTLRQELRDQSTRDPLTGLWNRRWFLETARREFARAREAGSCVSITSLDVDHFKTFNDHHGHDAGDMVLREVAQLMASHFSETGHACRIGGEEFVVLLPDLDGDGALSISEEFRKALSETSLTYDGQKLPKLTISGGVAQYPTHGNEIASTLKAADRALYQAKSEGRNLVIPAPNPN